MDGIRAPVFEAHPRGGNRTFGGSGETPCRFERIGNVSRHHGERSGGRDANPQTRAGVHASVFHHIQTNPPVPSPNKVVATCIKSDRRRDGSRPLQRTSASEKATANASTPATAM